MSSRADSLTNCLFLRSTDNNTREDPEAEHVLSYRRQTHSRRGRDNHGDDNVDQTPIELNRG